MEFKLETKGIEEAKKMLSSKLFQEVLKYTAQDLAKGARVRIKEKIQEGYNIKPSDLNKAMKIKMGRDPFEYVIEIQNMDKRGIPLFKLAGRVVVQTREGVWAEVRKGRAKAFTHAFISTTRSGHKGVFIRSRGGKTKGGRVARNPIHEIYGPRITSLVKSMLMEQTIKKFIDDNAQKIFKQKLNWKTGGLLGK